MTNLLFVSYSSKISSNRVNNLFKPRQRRLAVCRVTDFVSLRKSLQTTSASSATSKQCFEQLAASFLVCSLIFIEYQI
ncbi:S1 RNA-binding domain-containing protein [Streptococcus pneumoniae]|uniref:hypothetical protein n=1 Tax=Streptococcus pneumoniae TaxID=1313 RepID=UPI000B7083D8|nr:hypothetical protein [Streptococcus pneumoniae]SNE69600.1 S1 RNA-binding domain-containing protein [Streptococcus pneumoniae]